ncbi:MAG: S-layer homology domain-containing protein [Muribaculaceae bacterium]|nr:S-layer homology domain-containing protein [Muribaculaceae bacterium]
MEILKDGGLCVRDTLEVPLGSASAAQYTALVYDQYGDRFDSANVTWTLVGAPQGVTLADGLLTVPDTLSAGSSEFRLQVTAGSAQSLARITLTVAPVLGSLSFSGRQSVTIPTGSEELILLYDVYALDSRGEPMVLDSTPLLTLEPQREGVTLDVQERRLIITSAAQPGVYTLIASAEGVESRYPITLSADPNAAQAAQLAIYRYGTQTELNSLTLTQDSGTERTVSLEARLLDLQGDPLPDQGTVTWTLEGAPEGVSLENGDLTVSAAVPAGRYAFSLTAAEAEHGLSTRMAVQLTVSPVVARLTLTGPGDSLTIPTDGTATYTFSAAAFDAAGAPMELPSSLKWSFARADGGQTAGLSIRSGNLSVSSAAAPGELTVTVSFGEVACTQTVTLTTQGGQVLQLYRDGVPVSGEDLVNIKEGTAQTLSYQAYLIDQTTGSATPVTDAVWFQGVHTLSVDKNAERGTYSAQITAVAGQQSATVTASIAVYPNVVKQADPEDDEIFLGGLSLLFDEPIEVPAVGATKVYVGELAVNTVRGDQIPLRELGLDYELTVKPEAPGVRASYDEASHALSLILDSSAIAYKYLSSSQSYLKSLTVTFSYFPGESAVAYSVPLELTSQPSRATSALLRAGTLEESGIVFRSLSQNTDTITTAQNTFSNCYAIELRDQYDRIMTSANVTWSLEGAPSGVSLLEDADTAPSFQNYASFRRLSVGSAVEEGTYDFTLIASVGSFSHRVSIHLTVTAALDVTHGEISGENVVTIPFYYVAYNSDRLNTEKKTATYEALFTNDLGQPPAPQGKRVVWSLDKSRAGVSISSSTGTLTVDRNAKPGEIQVIATLMEGSTILCRAATPVELRQNTKYPTLLSICKNGSPLTSDTITLRPGEEVRQGYTLRLVDQYNDAVGESALDKVVWNAPSANGLLFRNGVLTVTNITRTTTLEVTATLPAKAAGNTPALTAHLTISLRVESDDGGGGGGGGGELTPSVEIDPVVQVAPSLTIAPPLTLSGTSGSATLTEEEEASLLAATGQGKLVIAPTGATGATSVSVTMSNSAASAFANQKLRTVELSTAVGILTLSPDALRTAAAAGSDGVTLSVSKTADGFRVAVLNGTRTVGALPGSNTFTAQVGQRSAGTVAVLIKADGTEVLLRKSVVSNQKLITPIPASGEVKLVDRALYFADASNHWSSASVSFVTARSLFQGTSDTAFTPNGTMTRGMLVTVLHRLEDEVAAAQRVSFGDVPQGTWYTGAVSWASQKGIVQGSDDEHFLPNDPVTREQLAAILYRYAQTVGLSTSARGSLSSFADSASVSSWAKSAVEWSVAAGLINGKDNGRLDPKGQATRAEVATILERLILRMAASR